MTIHKAQSVVVAVLLLTVSAFPCFASAQTEENPCLFEDLSLSIGAGQAVQESQEPFHAGFDCVTEYDSCSMLDRIKSIRPALADSGILFQGDITQFYSGVTHGGRQRDFRYGGHGDYVIIADGGKLGIQEGLFIKLRAEHRFGESISSATGALMPATVLPDLPVADSRDLYLTNVLFTQMLSEQFGVFAGKLDTLDGDKNAFAHGRGKTQFSNMAMVANPLILRTVPYSTLGAGFVVVHEREPIFTFTVLNPTDTVKTAGFDELFRDGVTLTAETRIPTSFFGMPGHQLVGGSWSSKNYVSLGQDPRIITGNVPIARQNGSWGLYWNFDQYLVSDDCDPTKGWGVFGRAAIGDDQANPLAWFLSFGVGGDSPIRGRSQDTFGAGWYYLGASSELGPFLGNLGDGQGVELYYNYQVSPRLAITPDLQIIMPGGAQFDTAVVVGLRACLTL